MSMLVIATPIPTPLHLRHLLLTSWRLVGHSLAIFPEWRKSKSALLQTIRKQRIFHGIQQWPTQSMAAQSVQVSLPAQSLEGRSLSLIRFMRISHQLPWVVLREPNELYAIGGGASLALPGQFISKMEAGSLREDWHTPLSNNNVTGDWLISGAGNFPIADGTIAVSQGQYLYKVNASTGAVEKVVSLPTGENPPGDSNLDGMNAFADGTLVLKTQNRVAGCTNQGYAFFYCANQSQVAPSVIVAVDPITFEVLDWEQLPEMIPPRNTVTQFQGKDYLYLPGTSNMFRYEWNGQNLTQDASWGPVPYLLPGQTAASAPAIMGDWIVASTNCCVTNASM